HTNLHSFDTPLGRKISNQVTQIRHELNLTSTFGCSPRDYYLSRVPYDDNSSLPRLLIQEAIPSVIVQDARRSKPRIFLMNSGQLRFDIFKGPFTHDDSFIVAPFQNTFQFLPSVPYHIAKHTLSTLNSGKLAKRRDAEVDGNHGTHRPTSQFYDTSPGYVTDDDFGIDGDDTKHAKRPSHHVPKYLQGNASFPTNGEPEAVDVIFVAFIANSVLDALKKASKKYSHGKYSHGGKKYSHGDIQDYLPKEFSSRSVIEKYAEGYWPCSVDQLG
ncbi:Secreted protein, partial [Neolecta irregularis DAH-3]